jgi:hypothetical protein
MLLLASALPSFAQDVPAPCPEGGDVRAADPCPTEEPATPLVVPLPPAPPRPAELASHGFRLGYLYLNDPPAPLQSPHLFVLGYELTQRALGGSWLDVIFVENLSVAGLNQSVFLPSGNALVGFRLGRQVELGTGVNVTPFDPNGKYWHQVLAAGWTPGAGAFAVPVHVTLIPDVDGQWRVGATVGVNW